MNSHFKIATGSIAGAAIGAAAIQGLHAQAKPPAYVAVVIQQVTDPVGMRTVMERSAPSVMAEAGGHYVIRTNKVNAVDGSPPQRFVLISFDSVEKAQVWTNSAYSKETVALRDKSTISSSFMVEGVAN